MGKSGLSKNNLMKQKQKIHQGNEIMDGMVNWEATSSDGDRFNATDNKIDKSELTGLACFDEYMRRKEKRKQEKNLAKLRKAEAKKSLANKPHSINQIH